MDDQRLIAELRANVAAKELALKAAWETRLSTGNTVVGIRAYEYAKSELDESVRKLVSITREEAIISYDIGCQPSVSGSGEWVHQTERSCVVLFVAIARQISDAGFLEDLGVAEVECINCGLSMFGYPNDEGRNEHRLWNKGLERFPGIALVLNSTWDVQLTEQCLKSSARIWRRSVRDVDLSQSKQNASKHFVFEFKENTFECIADDLRVTLHKRPYKDVLASVVHRLMSEPS